MNKLSIPKINENTLFSLKINYRQKNQKDIPHVVKLSGGRSSAFMLLSLLERGALSKDRGDVVVFNNTSAEHPETYSLITKLKQITENKFGIPFFLTEFATYEDLSSGNWVRYSTFRLVNEYPRSDANPDGYHHKGEVFEELLSHTAFLPNRHRRVCTSVMKIKVTELFLSRWFACETDLPHLGHYSDVSKMTDDGICKAHAKNGGSTPDHVLLKKRAYVRTRPHARLPQKFQDFTSVNLDDRAIPSMRRANIGGYVNLRSKNHPVSYLSLVGLRADEPERLKKLNDRVCGQEGREGSKPIAERVNTPLADNNITKDDISKFWMSQSWDLDLEEETNLTNCTFCFLKGSKALRNVMRELYQNSKGNEWSMTPMDVNWWSYIEKTYGRDLIEEERKRTNDKAELSFIGFFGENAKFSYDGLANFTLSELNDEMNFKNETEILACNCTD